MKTGALALTALILFTSSSFAARSSIPWTEWASERLTEGELKQATYLLDHALWREELRSGPDAQPGPEPERGELNDLDGIVRFALAGGESSRNILLALLESSSGQRSLKFFKRSEIPYGAVVTHIFTYHKDHKMIGNAARIAVARAFERADEKRTVYYESLVQFLVKRVLDNPEQLHITESLVSILALPKLRAQVNMESPNFFLLMSQHPLPNVRMAAFLGLSDYVEPNSFVREYLASENEREVTAVWKGIDAFNSMMDFIEDDPALPVREWKKFYLGFYNPWQSDVFQNRIMDIGDYNMERLAHGAAGQALLWSAFENIPNRDLILQFDGETRDAVESLKIWSTLPRLDGYNSSNGTGFHLRGTLSGASRYELSRSPFPTEPRPLMAPENSWLLMGLDRYTLDEFLRTFAKDSAYTLAFGHKKSVISWLKYAVLKLDPPETFNNSMRMFVGALLQREKEFKDSLPEGVVVGSLNDLIEKLGEGKSAPRVVSLVPKRKEYPLSTSIFNAPMEVLPAVTALFYFGEKSLATALVKDLFPKTWDLSTEDQRILAHNVQSSFRFMDDEVRLRTADVSDASKRLMLGSLLRQARAIIGDEDFDDWKAEWLYELKDERLREEALFLDRVGCQSFLF